MPKENNKKVIKKSPAKKSVVKKTKPKTESVAKPGRRILTAEGWKKQVERKTGKKTRIRNVIQKKDG
ncbi:MAG: hypothetical protein WD595_06465 [Waddliaceae bacterium]